MTSSLLVSDKGYDNSIDVCWSLSESAHGPVIKPIVNVGGFKI